MSAIWLDAPRGLPVSESDTAMQLHPGRPSGDVENLVHVLAGHEIVVAAHVSLIMPALRRCRWVRGVIGLGSSSATLSNLDRIRALGLLAARIDADGVHLSVAASVETQVEEMTHRLRALDDLADGWEGT